MGVLIAKIDRKSDQEIHLQLPPREELDGAGEPVIFALMALITEEQLLKVKDYPDLDESLFDTPTWDNPFYYGDIEFSSRSLDHWTFTDVTLDLAAVEFIIDKIRAAYQSDK